MDGSFFSLSHPTPSKAATPPKPIPFRVKHLNSFQASLYFNRLDAASRQGRAGQGRTGGRAEAEQAQGRAGQGRGRELVSESLGGPRARLSPRFDLANGSTIVHPITAGRPLGPGTLERPKQAWVGIWV